MNLSTQAEAPSAVGIVAQQLTKHYPGVVAVEQLDLTVERGCIVGLLGPNGAGKTTTLRMLAGILRPSAGQISVCGYDIRQQLVEVKRCIGFLSGDTQLYERLTVREVLRFFGKLHQMDGNRLEARIETLVAELEMQSYADRRVGTLSSGQTQRANIARTIVHDPEVLILDEATVSLDIISSQFIIETLNRLRDDGKAILFSTHIMSEAEYLCDRIALIYNGRVIDFGTPAELLAHTSTDNLTAAFLAQIQSAAARTETAPS